MEIHAYQSQVDEWIRTTGVRYFSELTNLAILAEEVGEVARLMARMYGEQSFRQAIPEVEQKELLSDELADIIWVVTCLANQTGINLEDALQKNFDKKNSRDKTRHINNPKLS
jgi:NTP pyrophosphatase (non-canonical NTP hydrolase)